MTWRRLANKKFAIVFQQRFSVATRNRSVEPEWKREKTVRTVDWNLKVDWIDIDSPSVRFVTASVQTEFPFELSAEAFGFRQVGTCHIQILLHKGKNRMITLIDLSLLTRASQPTIREMLRTLALCCRSWFLWYADCANSKRDLRTHQTKSGENQLSQMETRPTLGD